MKMKNLLLCCLIYILCFCNSIFGNSFSFNLFNPYIDTFEQYTNSTPLINGTNGWYASSSTCKIETNICNSGTNAVVIPVDVTLSNRPTFLTDGLNIRITFYVLPQFYDGTSNPAISTNVSAQFYINTNGHFVVCNKTNWVAVTNFMDGSSTKNIINQTNSSSFVKVQIYLDYSSYTWKLQAWTNNVKVSGTDFLNFTSNSLYFKGFDVYNGNATSYIDDVVIERLPKSKYNDISPEKIKTINDLFP